MSLLLGSQKLTLDWTTEVKPRQETAGQLQITKFEWPKEAEPDQYYPVELVVKNTSDVPLGVEVHVVNSSDSPAPIYVDGYNIYGEYSKNIEVDPGSDIVVQMMTIEPGQEVRLYPTMVKFGQVQEQAVFRGKIEIYYWPSRVM